MKKELERRDGERIHQWIDRLSESLSLTPEQKEAMREVAVESYIKGSDDAITLQQKYPKTSQKPNNN